MTVIVVEESQIQALREMKFFTFGMWTIWPRSPPALFTKALRKRRSAFFLLYTLKGNLHFLTTAACSALRPALT